MTDAELVALRDELARRFGDEDIAQEVVLCLLADAPACADVRGWCHSKAASLRGRKWRKDGRHGPLPEEADEESDPILPSVLTTPPDQLARLVAAEDIALAPPCLVEEAQGRRRLTRQRRGQARQQFRRRLRAREESHG